MVCIIGGTDLIPEKIPILRRGLAYRGEKTTTISLRTSRVSHLEILRSNMLSTNKYRDSVADSTRRRSENLRARMLLFVLSFRLLPSRFFPFYVISFPLLRLPFPLDSRRPTDSTVSASRTVESFARSVNRYPTKNVLLVARIILRFVRKRADWYSNVSIDRPRSNTANNVSRFRDRSTSKTK